MLGSLLNSYSTYISWYVIKSTDGKFLLNLYCITITYISSYITHNISLEGSEITHSWVCFKRVRSVKVTKLLLVFLDIYNTKHLPTILLLLLIFYSILRYMYIGKNIEIFLYCQKSHPSLSHVHRIFRFKN